MDFIIDQAVISVVVIKTQKLTVREMAVPKHNHPDDMPGINKFSSA